MRSRGLALSNSCDGIMTFGKINRTNSVCYGRDTRYQLKRATAQLKDVRHKFTSEDAQVQKFK